MINMKDKANLQIVLLIGSIATLVGIIQVVTQKSFSMALFFGVVLVGTALIEIRKKA